MNIDEIELIVKENFGWSEEDKLIFELLDEAVEGMKTEKDRLKYTRLRVQKHGALALIKHIKEPINFSAFIHLLADQDDIDEFIVSTSLRFYVEYESKSKKISESKLGQAYRSEISEYLIKEQNFTNNQAKNKSQELSTNLFCTKSSTRIQTELEILEGSTGDLIKYKNS